MNKYDQALHYEIFVKEEYACIKEQIKKAETIFDIGGHIGIFGEWCRSLGSSADIHYFEPLPFLYEQARERFLGDERFVLNPFGIGEKEENIEFFINEEKTMQSSRFSSFLNEKGKSCLVSMRTLQTYLHSKHIFSLDVMKMDIEGMEYEVLESWEDSVFETIGTLLVEIHILKYEDEQKLLLLQERLESLFSSVSFQKSNYSSRIGLLFAER